MENEKKTGRTKLAKENALKEFEKIVDVFGFNISTEAKQRVISMDINNIPMSIQQDVVDADAFITRIMEGRIRFDEEKTEIVYILRRTVSTGEGGVVKTKEFRFGMFTRAKQKASNVKLNECNFSTMSDEQQDNLLQAMTGVSDVAVLNALTIPEINDLRMIAGYFFN